MVKDVVVRKIENSKRNGNDHRYNVTIRFRDRFGKFFAIHTFQCNSKYGKKYSLRRGRIPSFTTFTNIEKRRSLSKISKFNNYSSHDASRCLNERYSAHQISALRALYPDYKYGISIVYRNRLKLKQSKGI